MKSTNKGVILLVALIVMTVLSLTLPAYVIWSIWDQKNLFLQQKIELANTLAQAGLNRATLDLYLDTDSWLDGEINGNAVHLYDNSSPDAFWTLYADAATFTPENLSYRVEIRYLYDTTNARFYDKRMWVRSTGITPNASRTVEELVNSGVVKNLTQNLIYSSLQTAITEALTNGWNNNDIAIAATTLTENIVIGALRINIRGCYDPVFSYRSCSEFNSVIQGNVLVVTGADVILGGLTIK